MRAQQARAKRLGLRGQGLAPMDDDHQLRCAQPYNQMRERAERLADIMKRLIHDKAEGRHLPVRAGCLDAPAFEQFVRPRAAHNLLA